MDAITIPPLFSLPQTLDCGQAFRWAPVEGGAWQGVAKGRRLTLWEEDGALRLACTREELETVWQDYFDLGTDYAQMREELSAMHPVLARAVAFAPGIRILRQDPWEALCSFIVSQNNNIPRIKGILARLCQGWGRPLGGGWFDFPTPAALAAASPEDLAPLRAGYRAKSLVDAARKVSTGQVDLPAIALAPLEDARRELQKIHGVGPKVAECTLLYGFHRTQCFPMDVWMSRAMRILLPGLSPADFGPSAGLAQQYIFHYSRFHPELF